MARSKLMLCLLLFSHLAFSNFEYPKSDIEFDFRTIAENLKMETSTIDGTYFYSAGNKRDALITPETVSEIDKHLRILDENKRKTILYMAYAWCELKANTDKNTQLKTFANAQKTKIDKAYEDVKAKGYEIDNINLHVCMYIYVVSTTGKTTKQTAGIFIDRTFARPDLSLACRNDINKEIKQAIAAKNENALSKSLNKGLIWRAELLKTKYLGCPIVPAATDDIKGILSYVKNKVANNQKVMFHTDAAGKPTIGSMVGENLKIDNTTYSKIQFKNFATKDPSIADPLSYLSLIHI